MKQKILNMGERVIFITLEWYSDGAGKSSPYSQIIFTNFLKVWVGRSDTLPEKT